MFAAHLVNEPCSDPGLYVKLKHRQEAFLFDLGDIRRLSPRQILRVSTVFVSHTHMDHFIGFDHLLRISLGRNGCISLFGPPGFIRNVEGKLASYTWNLVHNYRNDFILRVTEVGEFSMVSRQYQCRRGFEPEDLPAAPFTGTILDRDDLAVKAVFLDHRVPCLAFCLHEKLRINIMKNVLAEMGLEPGRWLREVKDALRRGVPVDGTVSAPAIERGKDGEIMWESIGLGDVAERAVRITPGRKIAYVTDALFTEENTRRIVDLARNASVLFIEAAFMDEDRDKAAETCHLTARQAGMLAREAGAGYIRVFHLSPRYTDRVDTVIQEAEEAFNPGSSPWPSEQGQPEPPRQEQHRPVSFDVPSGRINLVIPQEVHSPPESTLDLAGLLDVQGGDRVLELGCGCGILSIAAGRLGAGPLVATDLNPRALAAASRNAALNGLGNGIRFYRGFWYDALPPGDRDPFDMIIAIPPQTPGPFPFGPRYGGINGTDHLLAIIRGAADFLKPEGGRLWILSISLAHPRFIMKCLTERFTDVRVMKETQRPFPPEEYESLQPGLFDYLLHLKETGVAEMVDCGDGRWAFRNRFIRAAGVAAP